MKFGFVKAAAVTPKINVADVKFNTESIKNCVKDADKIGAELIVFPELCLTGYTCGDLFYSDVLIKAAVRGLKEITEFSENVKSLIFLGLPFKKDGRLYNVAAAVCRGRVLGLIPKTFIPNYNEFYEKRYFCKPEEDITSVNLGFVGGENVPFGKNLIFCDEMNTDFKVCAEICEDLWTASSPSIAHAENGATVIVNLSCSDETVGKAEYRRNLIKTASARLSCGYVYADAGEGESTTDMVFAGHNVIAENGELLGESKLFANGITVAEIDVSFLSYERSKVFNYDREKHGEYLAVAFNSDRVALPERKYRRTPFVPENVSDVDSRAELIISMQAEGLKKRIAASGVRTALIGLSGGLDSTLAAIVTVTAFKKLGKDLKDIIAVTMPCFGTTSRTFDNSVKLAKALGVTLKKIDIGRSVSRHLKDIGHDGKSTDAAYENAQARERTQVLMDIANKENGLVVGTGDLSELALGWATYNGDHMSMYGVNCSVPKTLVRHIVGSFAAKSRGKLKAVLYDILDTPVSPELLPPEQGEISQKTEDIVGPYVLHDFFLYYTVRKGFSPSKIYYIAKKTFADEFDGETILKWLKVFIRRFFSQQFKRSCVPDGVKVGSVTLSPRGDWRMPSDACAKEWLKDIENL